MEALIEKAEAGGLNLEKEEQGVYLGIYVGLLSTAEIEQDKFVRN